MKKHVWKLILVTAAALWTSANALAAPLSLEEFKARAKEQVMRCGPHFDSLDECREELAWAFEQGLITKEAYDWGFSNLYFTTYLERGKKVDKVCRCG